MTKENMEVSNLLQHLSNAISNREGEDAFFKQNNEFVEGVRKAIPHIENALNDLKSYFEKGE